MSQVRRFLRTKCESWRLKENKINETSLGGSLVPLTNGRFFRGFIYFWSCHWPGAITHLLHATLSIQTRLMRIDVLLLETIIIIIIST